MFFSVLHILASHPFNVEAKNSMIKIKSDRTGMWTRVFKLQIHYPFKFIIYFYMLYVSLSILIEGEE